MNSLIETLNQFGGQFLKFAWPMLWQSSLLIGFVLVLDFLLARKIRAAVRYALWLAVLVKLLLPPTLALPTGAAWWLIHEQPAARAPTIKHYTVTYDTTPMADFIPPTIPLPPPAPPQLNGAGWALLAAGTISLALLLWLTIRWRQVSRMVRRAVPAEGFSELLLEAMQFAGAPSTVSACSQNHPQRARTVPGALRLKIVEGRMSPAVCGLFRPVILLPRTLAEQLSPAQLRAVLLHEVFHLRRKDVWVNCAQALLQIVYWWHPLLWIANARIRRVREEAVDDAVMLALRDEADSYAPTLLEVAKLAFRRPLMSLGLVGIIESRSALRQRIERLVDFRAPRKAGLTFASLCGICVFSAVALPMGEGPAPAGKPSLPESAVTDSNFQLVRTFLLTHPEGENALKKHLNDAGVKIPPTFFYYHQGMVFARGTVEQLVLVNQTVLKLNGYSASEVAAAKDDFPAPAIPPTGNESTNFYSRHFRVGNNLFTNDFQNVSGAQSTNVSLMAQSIFSKMGVNLKSPGKSIFYNARLGELYVRATATDLDVIESGIEVLDYTPPNSIHVSGVITDSNFNAVIHALEQQNGAETLAEPEVVTTSGRGINKITIPTISLPVAKMDAGNLVQDAKLLYEQGKLDEAKVKLKAALALDPENAAAKYYLGLVQAARPVLAQSGRQNIVRKLEQIRLNEFAPFAWTSLGEVVSQLNEAARQADPGKTGVDIRLLTNSLSSQPGLAAIAINVPLPLKNLTLAGALDAITENASQPIKYSILDNGILISAKSATNNTPLFSRHFRVDTNVFTAALRKSTGMKTETVSQMAISYFKTLGVDLDMPGKSVFFGDRLGELFVRATSQDLDKIENAIEIFYHAVPQIHIKARFVEVPKGTLQGIKTMGTTSHPAGQTNQLAGLTGILTGENFKTVWQNLENQPDVESVAEPEVVTTSGRQTQMRSTVIQTVITNYVVQNNTNNYSPGSIAIVPQMSQVETGPVLDVVPYVLSDGYTINLSLIPSLTEFLGYDTPPINAVGLTNSAGVQLPVILPMFRVRQTVMTVNLWDGQTVVLGGMPEKNFVSGKEVVEKIKASDKELLVFITASIVDPAGNRIHSDADLPFAKDTIPPQPAAK